MKFLIKNIEKVIFVIFLLLVVAILTVVQRGIIERVKTVEYPHVPEEFDYPEKDKAQFEEYDKLLEKAHKPKSISEYAKLLEKNLFYEYVEPTPPEPLFIVKDIKLVPLDIMYQGFIELPDSSLVAQINLEDKTYFLREGKLFADYKVTKITKEFCIVLNERGKEMRLDYKRKIYSEEYEALLFDPKTKNLLKVKKDLRIKNYKVLDITATYVVLLDTNGEKIVLKKGEE